MKIYAALQIGEYHLNHCEDYLFTYNIANDKIVCAVMDGCTMGADSYFASTLVGRLLRKVCKVKAYKQLYGLEKDESLDEYLKGIMKELFSELVAAKNQLMLERNELLTTLIIMLFDSRANKGIVLAIGDGLVNTNGTITEFEQNNKPDYIGYHLSEEFDTWYNRQKQIIRFDELKDVTIATDGITTFTKIADKKIEDEINPVEFLTSDTKSSNNEDMLYLKLKTLENVYGLKPADDLGMIRAIGVQNSGQAINL